MEFFFVWGQFLTTTGATLYCAEVKVIFRIYDKEIITYFPRKPGERDRYISPPRRVNAVSVKESRLLEVHE